MKTLSQILELYKPKSQDEDKFVKKHIVVKHKDRNGNGDDVFQATNIKAVGREKERHGYEPGKDEEVYEEVERLDELSPELLRRAAAGARAKYKSAMDHNDDLGGGYENPVAREYNRKARKFDKGAENAEKRDRIKSIGISGAVKRKLGMKEEYESLDEVDTNAATQLHARLKDKHNKAVDSYDMRSRNMNPEQKKAEQGKIDKLHDRVERARSYIHKEEIEYIEEKLKVSDGIGAWISDFVHSDNPKFEGFSKRKRMKMAQAAFYSAQKGD
jgi:hypothetical protein